MTEIPAHDDGDPHAVEVATARETGAQLLVVAALTTCAHCLRSLPSDAAPCPGPGEIPGAQLALETITWRGAEGVEFRSDVPRVCVERHRSDDGMVRWPRDTAP